MGRNPPLSYPRNPCNPWSILRDAGLVLASTTTRLCLALVSAMISSILLHAAPATSPSADPFDPARVLEVRITMPPADWDKLRFQVRDGKAEFSKERLEHPVPKPYSWFKADVVIDGVPVANVGVRKRGFYGSRHSDRPALNLDLAHYEKGQSWRGLSEFKLHNNKQDLAQVRQSLSYQVFTAAGVAAPRCRLAHVTVNGMDLGIYSQVEAIDDAFLTRQFGNKNGNLYEAAISDFRPGWMATFERKNNKASPSRADLEAVTKALQHDDDRLLDQLEKVIDVDAFIRFWAVESLINHWDGFAGDQNNSFIYHDPATDKLRFIAWGADDTFSHRNLFVPFQPPASVLAVGVLPRRLYNHYLTREKYRQCLRELLATVWNEQKLLAEVSRMEKLFEGRATIPAPLVAMGLGQLRAFIQGRRADIEAELQQPAKRWEFPMRKEVYFTTLGKVSATFSGTWATNAMSPRAPQGRGRVEIEYYGRRYAGDLIDVKAGPSRDNLAEVMILATALVPGVEVPITIWSVIGQDDFRIGRSLEITGRETQLSLIGGNPIGDDFRVLAWMGSGGTIQLDAAEAREGAKISGKLEGALTLMPWDDFDLKVLRAAAPPGKK